MINLDDHRDERGFVVNPFAHIENLKGVSNCHAFSIAPHCLRGNHVHCGRNEQVLVLSGTVTVEFQESDESVILSADSPAILTIEPGVRHTFSNTSDIEAVALCWSSSREEGYQGPDTTR